MKPNIQSTIITLENITWIPMHGAILPHTISNMVVEINLNEAKTNESVQEQIKNQIEREYGVRPLSYDTVVFENADLSQPTLKVKINGSGKTGAGRYDLSPRDQREVSQTLSSIVRDIADLLRKYPQLNPQSLLTSALNELYDQQDVELVWNKGELIGWIDNGEGELYSRDMSKDRQTYI